MSDETKVCQFCGGEILAVAKKCKHCGKFLEAPDVPAESNSVSNARYLKNVCISDNCWYSKVAWGLVIWGLLTYFGTMVMSVEGAIQQCAQFIQMTSATIMTCTGFIVLVLFHLNKK